ncbi:MAG TPA: hypothetical protein DCE33_08330 [Rhodospirillaceae bacterium]|nr:hypothetical protein [Rhodospirillaceae bacterium]
MGILRLMLALAVLIGHSGGLHGLRMDDGISAILPSGQVAVQSFYMISGFYMSLVLSSTYQGPAGTWCFWLSRYLRLAPIYFDFHRYFSSSARKIGCVPSN